jgi:hypothetical protein
VPGRISLQYRFPGIHHFINLDPSLIEGRPGLLAGRSAAAKVSPLYDHLHPLQKNCRRR